MERVYEVDDSKSKFHVFGGKYISFTGNTYEPILEFDEFYPSNNFCGTLEIKRTNTPVGERIGPDYGGTAVQVTGYYNGELVGTAWGNLANIKELVIKAERRFAVQRLISSLEPNEGLICMQHNDKDILMKVNVETNEVTPIGTQPHVSELYQEDSLKLDIMDCAPMFIAIQDSVPIMNGDMEADFPSIFLLGQSYEFSMFNLDRISHPRDMSEEEKRNMLIGYSIAAFKTACGYTDKDAEQTLQDSYAKYFSQRPRVNMEVPDGFVGKDVPSDFVIDNHRIGEWIEEAESLLHTKAELLVEKSLEEYGHGYYFCIIEENFPNRDKKMYTLAKIKEGEEDKLNITSIDERTADMLKEVLPSYGHIETEVQREFDYFAHIKREFCVNGREPIGIIEEDTAVFPEAFSVSTAYASIILAGIENPDEETIDAARQLASAMGKNPVEGANVSGLREPYTFEVGNEPDKDTPPELRVIIGKGENEEEKSLDKG